MGDIISGDFISLVGSGQNNFKGLVTVQTDAGQTTVGLDGNNADVALGGNGKSGDFVVRDGQGNQVVWIRASSMEVLLGPSPGADPRVRLSGATGIVTIGGDGAWGGLEMRAPAGQTTLVINGGGNILAGGNGEDGDLVLKNRLGDTTMHLDGQSGDITLYTGDVKLVGADLAEEFPAREEIPSGGGDVLVLGAGDSLELCRQSYDRNVIGVVSGAGQLRPGIILGRVADRRQKRVALALAGKVLCKVDASYAPINRGDMLTTSPTAGHAMVADDPGRVFGAVLGKALAPLAMGVGLIPVLVTLH